MHHRVNCILLFSIKGQTGQNTTVIPHLRSHLHSPHFFVLWQWDRLYINVFKWMFTRQLVHQILDLHLKGWNRKIGMLCCIFNQSCFFRRDVIVMVICYFFPPPKQQIRKLRRELDASQEKVATLTSQLSANVSASYFNKHWAVKTSASWFICILACQRFGGKLCLCQTLECKSV